MVAPTGPRNGPCTPWCVLADLPCTIPNDKQALATMEIEVASEILFELSGRKFPGKDAGACADVVRPCAQVRETSEEYLGVARGARVPLGSYGLGWWEANIGGAWWGGACTCQRGPMCSCTALSEIRFDRTPVVQVTQVIEATSTNPAWPGSAVLDPSLYRVDDFVRLVRLPNADGSRPGWTCCQRLDLPAGAERTFQVSFTYGRVLPAMGVQAAAVLACQLFNAVADPSNCALGPRTQQVTRQGVTIVMDRLNLIKSDLTSLPAVDLFLRAVNPTGRRGRMRVASPDLISRMRRAGT